MKKKATNEQYLFEMVNIKRKILENKTFDHFTCHFVLNIWVNFVNN